MPTYIEQLKRDWYDTEICKVFGGGGNQKVVFDFFIAKLLAREEELFRLMENEKIGEEGEYNQAISNMQSLLIREVKE